MIFRITSHNRDILALAKAKRLRSKKVLSDYVEIPRRITQDSTEIHPSTRRTVLLPAKTLASRVESIFGRPKPITDTPTAALGSIAVANLMPALHHCELPHGEDLLKSRRYAMPLRIRPFGSTLKEVRREEFSWSTIRTNSVRLCAFPDFPGY